MNKKVKNIEHLYRESFEDFRIEPSSGLWKKISSKLAWKNFISFNPATINAYYLTGFLAVSIAGALWIAKPVSDNKQEIKEITIIEKNETPPITQVQEESRKAVGSWQLEEGISKKQEVNNQKIDSCINDRSPSTPVKYAPLSHFTGQAQQLVTSNNQTDSTTVVITKAEIQEPIPSIKHVSPRTQYLVPSTRELATPHPAPSTPVKYAPLSHFTGQAQNQAPSTDLPEPWLNIDSLFTNQTPTPPQHTIEFPNAFTPNTNGPTNGYYTPGIPNNDVFHPEYKGVVEYHLRIFNRRGEQIFESNDINTGWDGYINARLAAQDVYVWKASGRYSDGQSFVKFGNVMLIKK